MTMILRLIIPGEPTQEHSKVNSSFTASSFL
jgi:hypothetical protein